MGTDGACAHQGDARFARAGFGVYFGEAHSQNVGIKLEGAVQSAQRAELAALDWVLRRAWRPVQVASDSKFVCCGFEALRGGACAASMEHADLWGSAQNALGAKEHEDTPCFARLGTSRVMPKPLMLRLASFPTLNFVTTTGLTDWLCMGANLHAAPERLVSLASQRKKDAIRLQSMMVSILEARSRARPLPFRAAGFTAAELRALEVFPCAASRALEAAGGGVVPEGELGVPAPLAGAEFHGVLRPAAPFEC